MDDLTNSDLLAANRSAYRPTSLVYIIGYEVQRHNHNFYNNLHLSSMHTMTRVIQTLFLV